MKLRYLLFLVVLPLLVGVFLAYLIMGRPAQPPLRGPMDGTESSDGIWHDEGIKDYLNYLGRDGDRRYQCGFNFEKPDLRPGHEVAFARLRFASYGSQITTSARIVFRGVLEDPPRSFGPDYLPSACRTLTKAGVVWEIDEDWGKGSESTPLYYSSPNLSPVLNEILAQPGWGEEGRGIALLALDETESEGANFVTFADASLGSEGMKTPVELEVYPRVYDAFLGKEFLTRVSDRSVLLSLYALIDTDTYVAFGTEPGVYTRKSDPCLGKAGGEAIHLPLEGLAPDTQYYYCLCYRRASRGDYERGEERSFRTQRPKGEAFAFAIQSDEHINCDLRLPMNEENLALYQVTLQNIVATNPDFFISLGDFANTEFYTGRDAFDLDEAKDRYLNQRFFLDRIAHSIPFFLTVGNHEGENRWYLDATDPVCRQLPRVSREARNALIPNPVPSAFFKGDPDEDLADYYAWEWGDALFVVLNPFWYTLSCPHEATGEKSYASSFNAWDWTLGREQYDWLYETLHDSRARWKFVFIHHLTSATTPRTDEYFPFYGRGGIEIAKFEVAGNASFEWGGENGKGENIFSRMRPGWSHGPIHDLLKAEGVDILFHGHDHLFAKQDLDGIVYQECPQPVNAKNPGYRAWSAYEKGVILPNSGHLLVSVSPDSVKVDYVRSFLPGDGPNGKIAYSYSILR